MAKVNLAKLHKDAVKHAAKGNYKRAVKVYLKIYKENPDDTRVWMKIGDAYRNMGKQADAIEFYQKAATVFAIQGKLLQAIGVNKLILELDPEHTETQATLADLYARKKKLDTEEDATDDNQNTAVDFLGKLKRKGAQAPPVEIPDDDSDDEWGDDLELSDVHNVMAQATSSRFADSEELRTLIESEMDIPLFSGLAEDSFINIIQQAGWRQYSPDEPIVIEGDEGSAIYVVTEGNVRVTKVAPDNSTVALSRLSEGAFFGELSYFRGSPRTATVSAVDDVSVLVLERDVIDALIKQFPEIKQRLLEHYHRRLLDTIFQVSSLFRALEIDEREEVRRAFDYLEVFEGDQLIKQGVPSPGLFVIAKGLVEASSTSKDGEKLVYPNMQDGDFFGEISLISGKNATADCVAKTSCALYKLSRESFTELMNKNPHFKAKAQEVAVARSKRSKGLLDDIKSKAFSEQGLI